MKAASVKKFGFIKSLIVFSLILIGGIAFLVCFLTFNRKVPENFIGTTATISRIEETLSPTYDASDGIGPDDYDHSVFVTYSFNGETFTDREYGNYDSSMKEGDTVLVYVNPDDPSDFMSDPAGSFVFVIVGIVVILIGAGGLGYNIYKKKKGD